MQQRPLHSAELTRIVLIVGGLIVLALLAWQLSEVLLLAFAALVFASLLRGFSDVIQRYTRLPPALSFVVSCILIALLVAAFFYLLGVQIQSQLGALAEQLPGTLKSLGQRIGMPDLETSLGERFTGFFQDGTVVGSLAGYTKGFFGVASSLLIVIVAGVYLGSNPQEYRNGLLFLVPRSNREVVGEALDNSGRALRLWLVGQVLVMISIGVLTGSALFFLGLPSALALGFIAGILEFIPFLGPILAAVPALLIALNSDNPYMIYWVAGAYLVIQQIENNILVPLIQRQTVALPPVLGLFSLVAFGIMFGVLGILLAIPLTVVLLVLVKHLYVREGLEEEITLPGEPVEPVEPVEPAMVVELVETSKPQ